MVPGPSFPLSKEGLSMSQTWCPICSTRHQPGRQDCPGEVAATEPERHGWKVNVETPQGLEAYGVLVAPAGNG